MANPVQWTVDRLLTELAKVKANAQAEFRAIGANNAAVTDLYAKSNQITDPAQRAQVRGALERWATRQAKLQSDFNTAWLRYQSAYNGAAAFLRAVGMKAPASASLSGLGAVPILVPIAIGAAVVIATEWLIAVHENNVTQREALANQAARFNALLAGQISPADYVSASNADARLADQNKKKPPGDWSDMIVPALGLVALIVLGPRLLELMPRGKKAVAA